MKPSELKTAVPVVGAKGVETSINKDGTFGEYEVTIQVNTSPQSGAIRTVAGKTVTMTAAKLAAFREDHNESTGHDFLKEFFPEVLAEFDTPGTPAAPAAPVVPTYTQSVPVFPYEANNTNDFEVPPAVVAAQKAAQDVSLAQATPQDVLTPSNAPASATEVTEAPVTSEPAASATPAE